VYAKLKSFSLLFLFYFFFKFQVFLLSVYGVPALFLSAFYFYWPFELPRDIHLEDQALPSVSLEN